MNTSSADLHPYGDAAKQPHAAASRRRRLHCCKVITRCRERTYVLQSEHAVLSYSDWESKLPPKVAKKFRSEEIIGRRSPPPLANELFSEDTDGGVHGLSRGRVDNAPV